MEKRDEEHARSDNRSHTSCAIIVKDTEENVASETDCIFTNFIYQMYVNDVTNQTVDSMPSLPEIKKLGEQPITTVAQIGRQLAQIGDEINEKYQHQFSRMISCLNVTPYTAYDIFANVARKLFVDGPISWGRIVTLLCFGYRLAVTVLRRGFVSFFANVSRFIVRFVLLEKIAKWIADQGGWTAVMNYVPESIGWRTIGVIAALSALSVFAVVYFSRR